MSTFYCLHFFEVSNGRQRPAIALPEGQTTHVPMRSYGYIAFDRTVVCRNGAELLVRCHHRHGFVVVKLWRVAWPVLVPLNSLRWR